MNETISMKLSIVPSIIYIKLHFVQTIWDNIFSQKPLWTWDMS